MHKIDKSLPQIHILNTKYELLADFLPLGYDPKIELDLGCGKGGFSAAMARNFPDRVIISADVMLGRLRKLAKMVRRDGSQNIHLFRVEARHLVSIIMPDQSVDRLHILCPDPWPKFRHKGNRLLSSDFMAQINRILKKDGIFHFATDDAEYMAAVTKLVDESMLFERADQSVLDDVRDFKTEFETDWLAMGRTVPHVAWRALKNPFTGAH